MDEQEGQVLVLCSRTTHHLVGHWVGTMQRFCEPYYKVVVEVGHLDRVPRDLPQYTMALVAQLELKKRHIGTR